ncbi:FUSC family protein [Sphingomonas lacusdianchii]|jgi:hypothetical protein|uniref:FUSC family protein n=1 Tax=Sphingomonas lacusdianchii TaxID=2917992 RepID=UPI001F573258|nr:FUSC family protein [Sphingomonas sp. JXJ CY 53]
MHFTSLINAPTRNWLQSLRGILLSTIAAVLSWWAARTLFGDHPPVFAAIAAIVCLSPGIPSHGRQAIGMLVGVSLGIGVGEFARSLPIDPTLRIAVVTPMAMLAAASFGLNAVMIIQAGASAVIVVAGEQAGAGLQRVADAAVGGGIGLLFSQFLFTPDPVAMVDRAGECWLRSRARGGREMRAAAAALDDAIGSARAMIRWTVRGRIGAQRVETAIERWCREIEPATAQVRSDDGGRRYKPTGSEPSQDENRQ